MRVLATVAAVLLAAAVGVVSTPAGATDDYGDLVTAYGTAADLGVPAPLELVGGPVDLVATPSGDGYWVVDEQGDVTAFGDAVDFGDLDGVPLNQPIVGMARTSAGDGYWLVASDGGVFSFGAARFHGSTGDIVLNEPIVAMAPAPDGDGYWLVASDGGVFAFGSAPFLGSLGDIRLNRPVVGATAALVGTGYWMVASDGGVFAFGTAPFLGSAGDIALGQPIVAMATAPDGLGYWLAGGDGGVFTYGDADFLGSLGDQPTQGVVDIEPTPDGAGYWLLRRVAALSERCEGNGYSISYPEGWWANDGSVTERCSLFAPDPVDVPEESESIAIGTVVQTTIAGAPLDAVLDGIRSTSAEVIRERGGVIDGRGSSVITWETSDEGLRPAGTLVHAHAATLPDGRTFLATTDSLAPGDFEANRDLLDTMMTTVDLLVLDITTGPDTGEASDDLPLGGATLVDADLGRAPGFDRFVLEIGEDVEVGWFARYLDGPALRPGSGTPVDVDGGAILQIEIFPVRTVDFEAPGQPATYTGPERLRDPALGNIEEAVLLGDFEARTVWAVGVSQRAGFRVFGLDDPSRVVVDVNH